MAFCLMILILCCQQTYWHSFPVPFCLFISCSELSSSITLIKALTNKVTHPSPPKQCCTSAHAAISCWSFFFWLPRSQPSSCGLLCCTAQPAQRAAGRLVYTIVTVSVIQHSHLVWTRCSLNSLCHVCECIH